MARDQQHKKRKAFLRKKIRKLEKDYRWYLAHVRLEILSRTLEEVGLSSPSDVLAAILKDKHCPAWIKSEEFMKAHQ